MRSFSDYNPRAVFVFYACVIVPAMFCVNPVLLVISLCAAATFSIIKSEGKNIKKTLLVLLIPVIAMIINPLFVHNGDTTLFILNNNPITLETVLYGLSIGIMICATITWFSSFNLIMTSDKLLYIFSAVSPKIALILSMTLRYIPLYGQQIKKTVQAQKAMGLFKEETAIDKLRAGSRVFSVMVSWALENGVITADSMTARGYGSGKRSCFAIFKWERQDKLLIAASLALTAVVIASMATKALTFEWYPRIIPPKPGVLGILGYAAYFCLAFLPVYLHLKEETRWKSLQSRI